MLKKLLLLRVDQKVFGDHCHVLPTDLSIKRSCCIRIEVCKDGKKTASALEGLRRKGHIPQAGSRLPKREDQLRKTEERTKDVDRKQK